MRKLLYIAISCLFLTFQLDFASAAEPGWSPVIIATGSYGQKIRSTPIEKRPYRPLHFYGNAVRRNHYHGTVLPLPRILTRSQVVPNLGFLR